MTTINKREDILKHETPEYIASRPKWVVGRIPDLSDYRKLSVDSMDEAMTLAKLGQAVASKLVPTIHGKPLQLYFTQALIVGAAMITREMADRYGLDFEKYRSVLMVCPSRYGKSFLNAICCIGMAGASGKEVQIGAATMPKAEIIQGKVVELLPNADEKIQAGLIVTEDKKGEDKFKKIKRLATQVSKESLKWTNGGSIGLFSTNETKKNADVAAAGAIGIGGDYAVFDEVQLMTPVGFRTASRFMVESNDTKRFCVGNPMINGHFKELYDDPSTFVIHTNEVTAIIEERMTRRGIALTNMPTYSAEYRAFVETEFPDERSGTRFFTTLPQLWEKEKLPPVSEKHYFMGIDSAYKGGDGIIVTIFSLNKGQGKTWMAVEDQIDIKQKYHEWTSTTTMELALDILKLWEKYEVLAGCIDIGFGIHIFEAIRNLAPDLPLEPINYGTKPTEWRVESDYNAKFALNMRAELHLDLRDLCSNDLIFVAPHCYEELLRQMGEVAQSPAKSKIQIEAKRDIKSRLGRSPDQLDSACLAIHAMILSDILGDGAGEEEEMMEVL